MNKIKNRIIIFILFIAAFCFAASYFVYSRKFQQNVQIKVVADGEKNELSLGNNIRISKIVSDSGTPAEKLYQFDEISLGGNWNINSENNLLTCYNISKHSEAVFEAHDAESLSIDFISELGSGVVKIYINDKLKDTIDLYSDTDWSVVSKEYKISHNITKISGIASVLSALICLLCILRLIRKPLMSSIRKFDISKCKKYFLPALPVGIFLPLIFIIVCTAFRSSIYSNLYKNKVVLEIKATGEKSKRALGNNVRIHNIYVNGAEYDFSKINLKDGWQYNSGIDHLLYIYGTPKAAAIEIELNNVRTIEIEYVKEVASGIFEYSVNGKKIKCINSYKNCTWFTENTKYKASPLIDCYESYKTLLFLLILGMLTGRFIYEKDSKSKILNYIKFIDCTALYTFVAYMFIAFIQRESVADSFLWISEYMENFAGGFCILLLINLILSMILGNNYISFVTISVISVVLLIVSYLKIQLRDTPLLPWDFLLISVAATILERFRLVPSAKIILFVIIFAAIIIAAYFAHKKLKGQKIKLPARISTIIVAGFMLFIYAKGYVLQAGLNLFQPKQYYLEQGFVLGFAKCMQLMKPTEEPESYSKETMDEIYDEIDSFPDNSDADKPNIILLMSESFWDITRVKELNLDYDVFPTYKELMDTSVTGRLLANVFNGGTVNSEFEALTGFSVAYLPPEYMPYQRCLRPNFFSINSYLKSLGYESLAIHPFEKNNYNRNTAYQYLDFENALWEEDFSEDAERMRGYISDHALTEKIISEYEKHKSNSDSPWFNLSVSMQNHGGYWEKSLDKEKAYDVDVSSFSAGSQGSIIDLVTGLHYADLALGELIDYFETVEEPTVIIMFGDHMSNAGNIGDSLLEQSGLLGEEYDISSKSRIISSSSESAIFEQRQVPFMAWSNYKNIKKDCGILSITSLLPAVFSEYDIVMPKYFNYLNSNNDIYTACASNIFVKNDGSYKFIDDMNEQEKALYEKNQLIEYDYLFGKKYLEDLFDYNN